MTAERAASLIVAMGLHACALWLLKPGEHKMVQMAGEPEGPTVNVELVEATAPEEAPVVEIPPEPTPPEPTPPPEPQPPDVLPPEPTPPEPTPTPEPPPPPPDEMEEPAKAAPEPKPKPQPKPKPKPRPMAAQPAAKPGPPAQASAAPSGFQGAAARGSAKGDKGASVRHINKPAYPSRLKEMRVEPRTVILVVVSAEGRAVSSRIVQGSGYADWDQDALRAAREAVYSPKTVMGVAVQDTVRVPIKGNLNER